MFFLEVYLTSRTVFLLLTCFWSSLGSLEGTLGPHPSS